MNFESILILLIHIELFAKSYWKNGICQTKRNMHEDKLPFNKVRCIRQTSHCSYTFGHTVDFLDQVRLEGRWWLRLTIQVDEVRVYTLMYSIYVYWAGKLRMIVDVIYMGNQVASERIRGITLSSRAKSVLLPTQYIYWCGMSYKSSPFACLIADRANHSLPLSLSTLLL